MLKVPIKGQADQVTERAGAVERSEAPAAETTAPLLDLATQLAHSCVYNNPGGYRITLWPTCREASVQVIRLPEEEGSGRPIRSDPERSERVSQARSRTNVRRYCQHNSLTHMPTLTYGHERSTLAELTRDLRLFRRRLLAASWGPTEPFPYVWVPERGKQGTHRLHVHIGLGWWETYECVEVCQRCATANRRAMGNLAPAGSNCVGCIWGHGFVGAPSEGNGDPRALAGYVSKYVGKDLGELVQSGRQRYRVAEGFQPEPVRLEARTADEVDDLVHTHMGSDPVEVTALHEKYRSTWEAPATWSLRWETE